MNKHQTFNNWNGWNCIRIINISNDNFMLIIIQLFLIILLKIISVNNNEKLNNNEYIITYLKYGKLISKINDEITDKNINHDMIKFLYKLSMTIKQPVSIYQLMTKSKKRVRSGCLMFSNNKSTYYIHIIFDGKNNFHLFKYDSDRNNEWISINNVDHYFKKYPRCYLLDIIEKN